MSQTHGLFFVQVTALFQQLLLRKSMETSLIIVLNLGLIIHTTLVNVGSALAVVSILYTSVELEHLMQSLQVTSIDLSHKRICKLQL
jgi:hypothetical protein